MDWDLVARYVSTKLPERGRILDFGCYTGGLLARLDDRYERYGVEVNRAAADVASQNIGQPVWSSIDEIPSDLHFDVVIAADVIEHFSNPMSLVQQLAPRLSENGVLILTTGDADSYLWDRFGANWWYCFYPEHIAFISKDWLNYMCRVTDFSVAHYETFRYARLSSFRRLSDWAQTYFYGVLPSIYLGLARLLLKASTRGDVASVPGAGLTRDHLFIVLNKAAEN
jgi:2-polyprenyl-3-methyl-5-hydroxy-6-metoxy-1,4-benzoquinol methylase